jgi:hypothetical protein
MLVESCFWLMYEAGIESVWNDAKALKEVQKEIKEEVEPTNKNKTKKRILFDCGTSSF